MPLILILLIIGLLVPLTTIAPEGMFRTGFLTPLIFLWSCLIPPIILLQKKSAAFYASTGKRVNRFCLADLWVFLFFLSALLSLLVLGWYDKGNWRYGMNMFCTAGFLALFYATFRLLRPFLSFSTTACLLGILLAVCLTESLLALYGYIIRDPAVREAFLADPQGVLRDSGFNYVEGSPEWILLKNRILGSTEPLGSYGLTNTLAGVLASWSFLLSGFGLFTLLGKWRQRIRYKNEATANEPKREFFFPSFVTVTLLFVLFFAVLLLTKSRSGFLALVGGYGLFLMIYLFRLGRRALGLEKKSIFYPLGLMAAVLVLVGGGVAGAFATGLLDREVFTEAGKSLGYRLQYWQSSCQMIADYPFFGIGPGNFQTIYSQYILPEASEMIADPHNFVFEIAVVFGIPALVFFLMFASTLFIAPLLKNPETKTNDEVQKTTEAEVTEKETPDAKSFRSDRSRKLAGFFMTGGIAGIIVSYFYSLMTEAPMGFDFIAAGIVSMILTTLILVTVVMKWGEQAAAIWRKYRVERYLLLLCGMAVFLVNLGAAGGFFYPPVAILFWLFAALLVNDTLSNVAESGAVDVAQNASQSQVKKSTDRQEIVRARETRKERRTRSGRESEKTAKSGGKAFLYGMATLAAILPVVLYFVAVKPVIQGAYLHDLSMAQIVSSNYPSEGFVRSFKRNIAEVDPYSIPLNRLYYDLTMRMMTMSPMSPGSIYEKEWESAREQLLKIAPYNSALRESMGEGELKLYESDRQIIFLNAAIEVLTEAEKLFPTDATKKGLLAQALYEAGQRDKSLLLAREAMELNQQTPHLDRKLSEPLLQQMEKILKTEQK